MLYPPHIEGTIPAFYINDEGATQLVVPFSMNRSVSQTDVAGMRIKIKTVQGIFIKTLDAKSIIYGSQCQAVFEISKESTSIFNVGQYYKIQIAYCDKQSVGYFSTVGVIKCTSKPTISIANLISDGSTTNVERSSYVGIYENKNDPSEKVYSYRFDFLNHRNEILYTTGNKIHNFNLDDSTTSRDQLNLLQTIYNKNRPYYVKYSVVTTNKMELSTSRYRLMPAPPLPEDATSNAKIYISGLYNEENGYVDVRLSDATEEDVTKRTGTFKISRAASIDNFTTWYDMHVLVLKNQWLSNWTGFRDFTVEQGVTYKYAIQEVNEHGIAAPRVESELIPVDFEHIFLYDGQKQLKIKYNPKVATLKNTILETKTDTLGGKFPFIFRNGNVCYKELSISGLLSALSDDNKFFHTELDQIQRSVTNADSTSFLERNITALTHDNIYIERQFKLNVLDWLNNGTPKLFRSPTEGNYIVRLMNVSLSPNDQLGRMLHSFTSTAYEIANNDHQNWIEYGFINIPTTLNYYNTEFNKYSKYVERVWENETFYGPVDVVEAINNREDVNNSEETYYGLFTSFIKIDPLEKETINKENWNGSISQITKDILIQIKIGGEDAYLTRKNNGQLIRVFTKDTSVLCDGQEYDGKTMPEYSLYLANGVYATVSYKSGLWIQEQAQNE